jgi:hypothetical protein
MCLSLLVAFQNWPSCIPNKCQHHFPHQSLSFELLFDQQCQMFRLHTLVYAFWCIMVDPCPIPSNNVSKNVSPSLRQPWQIVKLLHFCSPASSFRTQTLWNPSWSRMTPWAEPWHLCDHFWTWLYIHTYYVVAKHCFHIVLKVCNGFIPLVHFQPTKIILLHTALLQCT